MAAQEKRIIQEGQQIKKVPMEDAKKYLIALAMSTVPALQSPSMAVESPKLKPSRDETLNLNDYYMASSHNTYLLGDQLTSQSSVLGYSRAIFLGCRCVECKISQLTPCPP